MRRSLPTLFSAVLLTTPLQAAEETGVDTPAFDVTAGLDTNAVEKRPWRHSISYDAGWASRDNRVIIQRLSWRPQWEGLLGGSNYVVVDAKLRAFAGEDMQNSRGQGIDAQVKLNALFVQKSLERSSWQLGYQVVNLGFMDMLAISDVITPWDYSEAVFTAPEDARLGQPIIAWSYFGSRRQWDVYLNLAPDHNRYAAGTDERLLSTVLGHGGFVIEDNQPKPIEQMEAMLRSRSRMGRHEQQWLLGTLLQNDPNITTVDASAATPVFATEYPRYALLGYGYSYTRGNHQWKVEAAYKRGLKPADSLDTRLDQLDTALGWEYNANGAWTLALEAGRSDRFLPAGASPLIEKALTQIVGRWSKAFLHDTLNLTVYAGKVNPGSITTASAGLSYTPRDGWYVELLTTQIDAKNSAYEVLPPSTSLKVSYYFSS